jgi:hypothetical protein
MSSLSVTVLCCVLPIAEVMYHTEKWSYKMIHMCNMHEMHYDWECICELSVCRNEFNVMASLWMKLILLYICSWMKILNYFSRSAGITVLTHCPFHVEHYHVVLPDLFLWGGEWYVNLLFKNHEISKTLNYLTMKLVWQITKLSLCMPHLKLYSSLDSSFNHPFLSGK